MSNDPAIIDPAWEISQLITQLSIQAGNQQPTWAVMQDFTGVAGAELYDLMSIMARRVARLGQFLSELNDAEFDRRMRERALQAIDRFSGLFNAAALSRAWETTKGAHVSTDDALYLSFVSVVAKRYKPLRKLEEEERAQLLGKIEEAISSIPASPDIPPWAQEPLLDGLSRLKLVIQKIEFFGVETAITALERVFYDASELQDQFGGDATTRSKGTTQSKGESGLMKTLAAVALAVDLLCALPNLDNAYHYFDNAYHHYIGWRVEPIKESPRLERCRMLLLTGPDHGPKSANEEESAAVPEGPKIEPTGEDQSAQ